MPPGWKSDACAAREHKEADRNFALLKQSGGVFLVLMSNQPMCDALFI